MNLFLDELVRDSRVITMVAATAAVAFIFGVIVGIAIMGAIA